MSDPGPDHPEPALRPPAPPAWGAGNVVLRWGPPAKPSLGGRIAVALGALVFTAAVLALPVLGLAMMGDPNYEGGPVATSTVTPVPTFEVTTVPVAFGGSWLGRGYQTMGTEKTWTARLNLLAGARTGRLQLVELGCSGRVAPVSSDGVNLRLVATMDDDPTGRCAPRALLRLSSIDSGQLSFSWEDAGNPENRVVGIVVKF